MNGTQLFVLLNRVAGRVIRFNYTKDESHCDNNGGRETQLLAEPSTFQWINFNFPHVSKI